MKVKIKKLNEEAVIPYRGDSISAGYDLTVVTSERIDQEHIKYGFGLAFEIPVGYAGFIFPRSSCFKKRQLLSNCVGVVDPGYTGEVSAVFIGTSDTSYQKGERCAQLIVMRTEELDFEEVDKLSDSTRGDGGYGSTGE